MRWSLDRLVLEIKNGQVVFIQARELQSTRLGFGGSVFGSAYHYELFLKEEEIVIQPGPISRIIIIPLRFPNTINYYGAFLVEAPYPNYSLLANSNIHLKFSDEVAYEDLISSPNLFGIFIHA